MLSKNEWDPLKTVIVGIADDARIPFLDPSLRLVNYADKKHISEIPHSGLYPKQVIDESNEDLEKFCDLLRKEGVNVLRPDKKVKPKYYNYCPRDTVLVHDTKIIAAPMALTARTSEYLAMVDDLETYSEVIAAPEPDREKLYNVGCLGNPDVLALNEIEPCFDAANVLRANDQLFYLVSNSGNRKGIEYLQKQFPNYVMNEVKDIYSYMHIDSTIAFLREGLMLCNPARIKDIKQLPDYLWNWDVIWAPQPVDIGHYPGYCNASTWVSVNLFSINPNLVVVEEHQDNLRRELEKHKIDVVMMPLRHARTLGGCFHCVTLDIERDHK
jgi:glycine amidinotransferase/scyllo-inosamine-4-phosphate amidinotransferase 1